MADQRERDPGTSQLKRSSLLARIFERLGPQGGAVVILLLLLVVFAVSTPNFLTSRNLLNILRQFSVPAILAIGQTLVIVSAGIDLSVASTAALSGSLMGVAFAHWGLPGAVAIVLGLTAGFLVGAFNGFAITRWRVPDIIVTLGTFSAVRGVALLVTDGLPVPTFDRVVEGRQLPDMINTLGAGTIGPIPLIAVMAAIISLIGAWILGRTKMGRSALAVGGNREAAHASGVNIKRTKMSVYLVSGLIASVAGMLLAGRLSSANALMGEGMELQSIAAVVVGGTALFGGEGSVGGTVVGVLIIGVLSNGLNIIGVSEFWQRVSNGLIIVLVVALDQWRRRATAREETL